MPAMDSTERLFLQLERPGFPFDIAGFAVLEASPEGPLPFEQVRALFAQRYHQSPLMTRAVAPAPLGIGQDRWIDVGALDIDQHVHHATVPPPGDMDTLLALILKLSDEPLARNRPLWDAWYLTGMADGTAALLMRTHHASIDGVGIMQLQRIIHDTRPTPVDPDLEPDEVRRGRRPSLLRRALYEVPDRVTIEAAATTRLVKQAGSAIPDVARSAARLATGTASKLGGMVGLGSSTSSTVPLPALPGYIPSATDHPPVTVFNKHVYDSTKALAVTSLPLADVQRVRESFPGVTVNDVLLTLVTGTLRRYLAAHDDLPERPLRTTCPVNIRTAADQAGHGNFITTIWIDLPAHLADPLERLQAVHANSTAAKQSLTQTQAAWQVLSDIGDLMLPGVTAAALSFGGLLELLPPTQNLTMSTVRGSHKPIYFADRKITHMFARTIICPPITLFISSVTYNGKIDFSITTVAQLCPDPKRLATGLREELDELLQAGAR